MFRHRSDGKFAKDADPILGMTSHIMPHRYDAMVHFLHVQRCEPIDEYIKEMSEQGIRYTYMDILIATLVRMYAERPKINRFVMNGSVFDRKGINICFAAKTKLNEDAPESVVKMHFTGEETLFEIKQKIEEEIAKVRSVDSNDTDKTASMLKKVPNFLTKFIVSLAKFLDKHGLLPKWLIRVSPFHSGCWVTNMKSISTDFVYHHLYDFGTSSLFIGLGKERQEPVVNPLTEQLEVGKVLRLGVVIDERICDGFYYAKSIKLVKKYMSNPKLLEQHFELSEYQKKLNYTKEQQKKIKKDKKMQKKLQKKSLAII